ncbi:hypothetical protein QBZ16_000007 [Prototheca wickerhamii]|uniref:Uncharacterized protein n=1 Tax=Prototheca wickerhamii TaxID=3111 RepID=A0AAD9IMU2_PROWI|nr:hypothetical protein QBZ16_000007 [Prototheca wickerhamii]
MTAYRLLKPGPHPVDELRGDVDLFEAHNLSRIANAVLGGALKHGDYLRGMTGATEFRKGPNLLLAPLAVHAGSHQELSLPPLPRESLVEGCHLSTEHFELTEVGGR